MTEKELREHHRTLIEAEQGLVQVRAHVFTPMAQLTDQTESPAAAKMAYHADAILSQAFQALRDLRRELQFQIDKLPSSEDRDEHESNGGIGA